MWVSSRVRCRRKAKSRGAVHSSNLVVLESVRSGEDPDSVEMGNKSGSFSTAAGKQQEAG